MLHLGNLSSQGRYSAWMLKIIMPGLIGRCVSLLSFYLIHGHSWYVSVYSCWRSLTISSWSLSLWMVVKEKSVHCVIASIELLIPENLTNLGLTWFWTGKLSSRVWWEPLCELTPILGELESNYYSGKLVGALSVGLVLPHQLKINLHNSGNRTWALLAYSTQLAECLLVYSITLLDIMPPVSIIGVLLK